MDTLEYFANRMMDADAVWWPFIYLRPEREQAMTTGFVVRMALHFGPLIGVLAAGIALVGKHEATATQITGGAMLASTLGFFAFYRLTFAILWNRRAARMKRR